MLNHMLIRTATDYDWPAIWPFLHSVAAAGETLTCDRDISEDRARAMWLVKHPGRTVVAVETDQPVVGTAKTNPNHGGPGGHIANASFIVDPHHAGCGVGRALAEHALNWARTEGFRAMQFNAVVATNQRAVALWRSLGFEVLATVPEGFHHPVHGFVGLHIMHRQI